MFIISTVVIFFNRIILCLYIFPNEHCFHIITNVTKKKTIDHIQKYQSI